MKQKRVQKSRTILEKLLFLGIGTFFLWPFVQLYSIRAIPVFQSDTHIRAGNALRNIMEKALSEPHIEMKPTPELKPITGYEDIDLVGRVEVLPHPRLRGLTLYRAQVNWGVWFFRKSIYLEAVKSRSSL